MRSRLTNYFAAAFEKPENRTVLILSVVALLVRLPEIGYSFYGDEHFSLLRDSMRFYTPTEDRFRPVFFSLLYLWRCLGFQGEVGLRILPMIFGMAQIPVAYFVGKRLGGAKLARVFAVLMTASPILIEFSQELRMYSLVALLALLQALSYLRLAEKPSWGRWAVFVLVAVLGIYTHLHYWLFLAGFGLLFLIDRRAIALWKGWGALAAALVLYLPNLPNVKRFAEVRGGDYIVHLPSALPKLVAAFTLGFNYIGFKNEIVGRPVGLSDALENIPLFVLAGIPAVMILWSLIRAHFQRPMSRTVILCHGLFTVPILLAFAACAVTRQYWLQPKYVIFSAPFALLFIAEAYVALSPTLLRRGTAALGLAACAVALIHFWTPSQYGRREDWRGAAQMLQEKMTPNSAFILAPGTYALLSYYWPEAKDTWQMVTADTVRQIMPHRWIETATDHPTEFLYLWSDIRRNESDPRDEILQAFLSGSLSTDSVQLNPRLKLYHGTVFDVRHMGERVVK